MEFITPRGDRDRVVNDITVGAYYAVGLDLGKVPARLIENRHAELKTWSNLLNVSNYTDDRVLGEGEMLYTTALAYFFELDVYNEILSRTSGVFLMRQPSEAMVALDMAVGYLFWSPYDLDIAGLNIDVDRSTYTVLSETGNSGEVRSFMLTSGNVGSALEHAIFEQLYSVPSVSAVKILQVASEQGLKIYNINASNVDVVLPRLQVSQEVKEAGEECRSPGKRGYHSGEKHPVLQLDWRGVHCIRPGDGRRGVHDFRRLGWRQLGTDYEVLCGD